MKKLFICILGVAAIAFPGNAQLIGKLSLGGPVGPDGKTEVVCDLPVDQRKKNIGSPPPRGPGCCVFRSLDHASRWQNVPALYGFPEWMVKNGVVGGGYPSKVDQLIPRISKDRGLPTPDFIQYEGKDFATVIKAALATGRMPCITYNGHDPHYGNVSIAHMVNCVLYDEKADIATILDNNYIGEQELVHMTCAELRQRCAGSGGGWVVVLLNPPPPPPPTN